MLIRLFLFNLKPHRVMASTFRTFKVVCRKRVNCSPLIATG